MPYTVEVPGRGVVEVPDDVPLEEASREIEKAFPPTGEEVASILSSNPDYVPTVEEFKLFKDYSAQKSVDWSEAIAQGIDSILQTAESAAVAGVSGAALNPANYLEGFAQGTQQMVDLVSQSQDPESPLFKFKNYIAGDGSIESQRQQFIEARKQAKEADQYARGEKTFLPKELVNPEYVQGVAMVADPSLFFPGLGQVLGAEKVAAKAVGKAVQATGKAVQAVSRPVQRAAAAVGEKLTEAVGTSPEAMRGALATSGVLAATGAGPAVGLVGAIPVVAGAATDIGTALEAAGGQLYRAPTRIGALESIGKIPEANLRQRVIGTIGRYGGDAALNAALVGTTGSLEGAAIGGVLGYLSGGEEGAAAGIGSGAAAGALGSLGARGVQTLTGAQARAARKGDFDRYVAAQDEKTAGLLLDLEARHGLDVASSFMDATGVVRGVLGDVGVNLLSSEDFRKKFGVGSRGVQVVEAETPAVYINADIYGKGKGDNPLYTLGHEMFHAFESSQQLADRASEVKDALVGSYVTKDGVVTKVTNGLFDDAEVDRRFNEYRDKLTPERAASLAEYDTTEKRGRFIASEIAGEYMGALLAGQKPDSMLRGFGGSTRSLLDSVLIKNADSTLNRIAQKIEQTFGTKPVDSVLFPEIKKASPQLNAMLRDLVRARGKLDERILAGDNDVTRAVRPGDMGNPISAKIAEDFGLAETENGVTRWLSDEVINLRNNRDNTAIQDILLTRPGARLIDGAIYGRLSPEQLSAIERSQQVSSRAKNKIRAVTAAIENGNSIFIDYNAATRRVLNKLTGKYQSKYSSGIRLSQREVLPYAFYFSQADNPVIKAIDITKMRRVLEKMTASDGTVSGQWQNIDGFMSDFARYLTNLDSGMREPSAKLFGEEKAKILGDIFNEQEKGGRKFIRDFRLDRMGSVDPRNFRAKVSEEAIQFSKLRWMPDETVGDARVINSEEGYRIVAKDKYRLYGPDGKLIGIYDKQQQAERKADATETRLQPEIDQLQRPKRNEVRQTPEAGGRNRIERRTQGSQEGGEVNQQVRQEGDVGRFMPDQQGFYSKLEDVVANKLPKSATPQQILATVDPAKGSGVKAEELKWTGFAQAVERIAKENGGKVPKEKLMEHLQNEGRVRFEEVDLSEKTVWTVGDQQFSEKFTDLNSALRAKKNIEDFWSKEIEKGWDVVEQDGDFVIVDDYGDPVGVQRSDSGRDVWEPEPSYSSESEAYADLKNGAKEVARSLVYWNESQEGADFYSKYQLPGGRNYREVVLTSDTAAPYTSSHFKDIPNYVAHMRVNERAGPDGRPGLFIEEIQSDRHQQARKKGYAQTREEWLAFYTSPDGKEVPLNYGNSKENALSGVESGWKGLVEIQTRKTKEWSEGIPDAPFRSSKDWSLQMFKRGLRDAVASGKEWIGWTAGIEQVKRYENEFRKSVDTIRWEDEGLKHKVVAIKDGKDVFSGRFDSDGKGLQLFDGEEASLSDVVGKDIADQIIKGQGKASGVDQAEWSGSDLTIGGEGMKGFYDTILPLEVQKYVKQWGGEVKKSNIPEAPIWRVDITPQMRESVQKTGQARFMPSDTDYLAAVKAGDTQAAQQMVDQAAKAAGYTIGPVYHGTASKKEIVKFDTNVQGPLTGGDLPGTYFTERKGYASAVASLRADDLKGIVKSYYLKFKNMASSDDLLDAFYRVDNQYGRVQRKTEHRGSDGVKYLIRRREGKDVRKRLEALGFDGAFRKGATSNEWIAFDPTQIKSADPITYDNSGNVIPLSQRFQQSSADIRYMPAALVPDSTIPGAYSMSGYRVLPGKTGGRMRVYSPTGSLIGIAASTDEAQRLIQKKLR